MRIEGSGMRKTQIFPELLVATALLLALAIKGASVLF
jgi:hypothetical protein